ncbi:helix-turn-helix domain-containing protein [Vagococcus fluvialis]|uniref:helix-turn-helix domain-containing protein n=1 Tax=Vagococcus fluvialis TaxID=2738 RepID=UPI003B21F44A
MILIKLKDVLDNYDLSIADLSDGTGIARSTLTPLVNSPDDVKGLKLETIDSICDFLGIDISELLEFKANDNKYSVSQYWTNKGLKKIVFLIKKKVGTKDRYSLISVDVGGFTFDSDNDNDLILNSRVSFLSKDEVESLKKDIDDLPDLNAFPKSNIFKDDLIKQTDENIIMTSKLLVNIIKREYQKIIDIPENMDITHIKINWNFNIKTANRIVYTFDITDKNKTILVDNEDVRFLEWIKLEDF